jgi:hypothetical protein
VLLEVRSEDEARQPAGHVRSDLRARLEGTTRQLTAIGVPTAWTRRALDALSVIAVWAFGAGVFFRNQWTSGFRNIIGDDGDARLTVYLLEHWYRVFQGHAAWRDPAFFYPVKGVLGWSDALFSYELFYAPLRAVGCDPFLAAQLTLVLTSFVGFASFAYLARLLFGAPRLVALLGGLVFTFSNVLWLHAIWYQLLSIWIVPFALVVAVGAFRRPTEQRRSRLLLAAACGLVVAVAFYTSYYVSWFSVLAAVVTFLLFLLVRRRLFFDTLVDGFRKRWVAVLVAAGAFGVGMIPFLFTYLPASSSATHKTYQEVLTFAARPADLLNIGPGNVFWSHVIHTLLPSLNFASLEQEYVVTPLVMLLAVIGSALVLRTAPPTQDAGESIRSVTPAVLTASAMVLLILPVKTPIGSPWILIWHLPGGFAIRAIDRIGIVSALLASLALVAAASELDRRSAGHRMRPILRTAVVVLLCVAVVEQLNTAPNAHIQRPSELAILRSVHAPPAGCRTFFVVDSANVKPPWYELQTEAMVISERLSVPTINGYTGYLPNGWSLLDPSSPGYLSAVESWIGTNRLEAGMCRLDLSGMRWSRWTPAGA